MDRNLPPLDPAGETLRRLGNPYAKLQTLPETLPAESETRELLTVAERAYVRLLQNPYASLGIVRTNDLADREPVVASGSAASGGNLEKTTLSRRDFEAGCRGILRRYIPPDEKGRLRPHHRDFIARNASRSPKTRYRLLEALVKYDLSSIPGFEPMFNRERAQLTAEKLTRLEKDVIGEEV